MIIGLDGQPLQGMRSGAGWYLTRLLEALADVLEEDKVFVWMNNPQPGDRERVKENRFLEVVEARYPATALKMSWTTLGTPTLETLVGRPLDVGFHVGIPIIPQKSGAKVVVLNDVTFLTDPLLISPAAKMSGKDIEKNLREADLIVTCSEYNHGQLLQLFPEMPPERVRVIPHGLTGAYAKPVHPAEVQEIRDRYGLTQPYFLFTGTLEQRKNLLRLVHAFLLFKQTFHADHLLVLAGAKGWIGEDFLSFIQSPALVSCVKWLDAVPEADLPALVSGAACFLYPVLKEGFGLPVLEAMGCGAPVIASNDGAVPEIAGEAAYRLDPSDVAAWTEVMGKIVQETALAEELRSRGFKCAAQYKWEETARKTLEALRGAARLHA